MSSDSSYPELFLCNLCHQYREIEELVETQIKGQLFPKNVCKTCLQKVKNKEPLFEILEKKKAQV